MLYGHVNKEVRMGRIDIKIPEDEKQEALAVCKAKGSTLSEEIRKALRRMVVRHKARKSDG